jgi:hypothetical protein
MSTLMDDWVGSSSRATPAKRKRDDCPVELDGEGKQKYMSTAIEPGTLYKMLSSKDHKVRQ